MSFNFPPEEGKEQNPCWKFTYKVPPGGDIDSCRALRFLACTFRSPSEAEEGAGVFRAAVGPAGDPLVLEVQHFRGARPLRGAAPLELWHPPKRGRRHRLADRGAGRTRLAVCAKR